MLDDVAQVYKVCGICMMDGTDPSIARKRLANRARLGHQHRMIVQTERWWNEVGSRLDRILVVKYLR